MSRDVIDSLFLVFKPSRQSGLVVCFRFHELLGFLLFLFLSSQRTADISVPLHAWIFLCLKCDVWNVWVIYVSAHGVSVKVVRQN